MSRFGRMTKPQRRALRLVIHDGASIGEILLLLLVTFSNLNIEIVAPFMGITQRRANDLLRSVTKRISDEHTQRDFERNLEHYADSERRQKFGKSRRQTMKEV